MTIATGVFLIVLPIAFNVIFGMLAVQFEYPQILREPTADVLAKFRAGGTRLLLTWWAFAMTGLMFIPVAAFLAAQLTGANAMVVQVGIIVGVLAGLVQVLGLIRWPLMVPHLARESETASAAKSEAIDVVFQSFNRYLGVAVGEHLGYLLTGTWTVLIGIAALQSDAFPALLGVIGIVIGAVLAVCCLEFIGPFEREGWKFAGLMVPVTYIAWSLWVAALGVVLLINA